MQFKDWLLTQHEAVNEYGGGGGAATSLMHGGIGDPGSNETLPVRSNHVATDGYKKNRSGCKFDSTKKCKKDKEGRDPESPEEDAADKFGFKKPEDKEEPKERWKSYIDKKERSTSIRSPETYT